MLSSSPQPPYLETLLFKEHLLLCHEYLVFFVRDISDKLKATQLLEKEINTWILKTR